MSSTLSFTAPRMEKEAVEDEFEALPAAEKEDAMKDVHGIKVSLPEDPTEPIASSLSDLRILLQQEAAESPMSLHYRRAVDRCPDYVNDDAFLLLFLRAASFDSCAAQTCLYGYCKEKEALFGDTAYRKLTAEDLTEDDLEPCRAKCFYFMPHQDSAGRGIVISVKPSWSYGGDWRNMARWIWYCMEAALENPSTQINGFISLCCNDGPNSVERFNRKFHRWLTNFMKGTFFPARCVAVHLCYDSKVYEFLLPLVLPMMGQRFRSRLRFYPGSKSHTRPEKFQECGLEQEMLPTLIGGQVDFDVSQWLEARRAAGL